MSANKTRLALFDLDHTLLPIDSDYSWGVFTQEIGWTDPVAFKERNDEFFEHYKAGTLDIHDYVRFATEAVRLKGPEDAAAAHLDFMHSVIRPALRQEALDLVRSHQAAGDTVVIVTATNEFVTRPIARAFGVEELIAVRARAWAGRLDHRGDPGRALGARRQGHAPGAMAGRNAAWTGPASTALSTAIPSTTWPCWRRWMCRWPPTRMRACVP